MFDRDGDGLVSATDLRYMLGMLGHGMSPAELDRLVSEFNFDSEGLITVDEILDVVQRDMAVA